MIRGREREREIGESRFALCYVRRKQNYGKKTKGSLPLGRAYGRAAGTDSLTLALPTAGCGEEEEVSQIDTICSTASACPTSIDCSRKESL